MENEKAIAIIKSRIVTEHGKYAKHPEMDWAEIAARKIYSEMKEVIFISSKPDVIKSVCPSCNDTGWIEVDGVTRYCDCVRKWDAGQTVL